MSLGLTLPGRIISEWDWEESQMFRLKFQVTAWSQLIETWLTTIGMLPE